MGTFFVTRFAVGGHRTHLRATTRAGRGRHQFAGLINLHQIDMGEASALVLALVLAQQLATQGTPALLLIDGHRGLQAAHRVSSGHIERAQQTGIGIGATHQAPLRSS